MEYPRDVSTPDEVYRRCASRIRLILLDVDGVLTDGRIYVSDQGIESRAFDARDGLGIKLGQLAGLTFGVISGRESPLVEKRARELAIEEIHQRVLDKVGRAKEIRERLALDADAVCYVGDDLIDLPLLRTVGLSAAPADAVPEVRAAVQLVTSRPGGRGAVREVVDLVLQASGRWDDVTRRFYE